MKSLNKSSQKAFTLVLWGNTNVGKSTLFNRLSSTRKAIVANRPGVTVDTHSITIDKEPLGTLRIIDSGGVGAGLEGHPLKKEIEERAFQALAQAQLILFVADGTTYNPELKDMLKFLRKNAKGIPVILVLNKFDRKDFNEVPFYALGIKEIVGLSADHGTNVGELWEKIESYANEWMDVEEENTTEEQDIITNAELSKNTKVLILGRPNVGKSTLMNYLTNSNVSAVSPVAGTTRDYITQRAVLAEDSNVEVVLTDTAGMRRPGRRERDVEWVATQKIIDLTRQAQMAVLLIDATEGVTDQDAAIAGFAIDSGLSLIVAMNKWDTVKEHKDSEYVFEEIERSKDLKMAFLSWCPVVRISAKTGLGIKTLKEKILELSHLRTFRVQTAEINRIFEKRIKDRSGVSGGNAQGSEKLYYMSQVASNPPEFVVFCNLKPDKIHFSFRRYVSNVIRDEFGFEGTPLKVHFKQR
jgi:GTP-binding protein